MANSPFQMGIRSEYVELARSDTSGAFAIRLDPPSLGEVQAPVSILLALDVSGSMHGEKLRAALASARALANMLGAQDTFGCVTFSDGASVLVPPARMNAAGKAIAAQRIGSVAADGNTDLSAAILKCLDLASELPGGARVLLLTDGRPTCGVTGVQPLLALTAGAIGDSTLSTFGFGRDVNPALLQSIAETGKGGYTFVDGVEAPMAAIGAEVGGVLHTVLAGASLVIRLAQGVVFRQIHRRGGLKLEGGNQALLELPPLVQGEPVTIAVELAWPGLSAPSVLGTVAFRARRTDTGALVTVESEILPRWSQSRGPVDPEVGKQLVLARAALLLDAASKATGQPSAEVARGLTVNLQMLRDQARAAAVEADEQVVAAFAMIENARQGLGESAPRVVDAARQNMVAASGALRAMKGTMMGLGSCGDQNRAFTSASQLFGMRLIERASKSTEVSEKRIVIEADDDDEPQKGPFN